MKTVEQIALSFCDSSGCEILKHHKDCKLAKAIEEYTAQATKDMTEALNKIHDLVGQIRGPLADHPHLGAIQAWVHKVLPCVETKEPWTDEQKAVLKEGLDALQKKFPAPEKALGDAIEKALGGEKMTPEEAAEWQRKHGPPAL